MTHYIAVVEKHDEVFGAFVPDCPGCTAMGRDADDAVHNITEALREWMADRIADGAPPPYPSAIEEIGLTEAASGGAVLASIPLLLDEGRLVRPNISPGRVS